MFVVLPLSFDVWVKKNISGDQSHEGLNVTGQGRRFEWLNRGSNRLTQKPGTAIPLFETSIFYEHLRNISETSQKHLRNISEFLVELWIKLDQFYFVCPSLVEFPQANHVQSSHHRGQRGGCAR